MDRGEASALAGGGPARPRRSYLPAARREVLARLERGHFWTRARRRAVEDALERCRAEDPVLDLGCGTGDFAARLAGAGRRVLAVDGERASAALDRFVQADAARLPLGAGGFGTVLLLDVLEHADDAAVLSETLRVLRPGGHVLVSVPAHPALWSPRDVAAGHLRRYRPAVLRRLLADAGFEVLEVRHLNFVLLPVLAGSRLLSRRWPSLLALEERPPGPLAGLLRLATGLEVRLGRRVRWPAGSSVLAVARKPQQ